MEVGAKVRTLGTPMEGRKVITGMSISNHNNMWTLTGGGDNMAKVHTQVHGTEICLPISTDVYTGTWHRNMSTYMYLCVPQ